MKKIVFALATSSFLFSCGLPEGGNKGVLKKEEGVVRYDDENAEAPTHVQKEDSMTVKSEVSSEKKDSTAHQ